MKVVALPLSLQLELNALLTQIAAQVTVGANADRSAYLLI